MELLNHVYVYLYDYLTLPMLVIYGLVTGWILIRVIKMKEEVVGLKKEELSLQRERLERLREDKDAIVRLKDETINSLKDYIRQLETMREEQKTGIELIRQLSSAKLEKAQRDFDSAIDALENSQLELDELRQIRVKYQNLIHEIGNRQRLSEDFLMVMTHEILAPLAAIHCRADFLKRYLADATEVERNRYLDDICSETRVIEFLLRNLWQVHTTDDSPYRTESCRAYEVIKPVVKMLSPYAESKKVRILFEQTRELPEILVDRGKFETAVYNVVANAVQYSWPNSTIEIGGAETDDSITIRIANTGIRIHDHERRLIFSAGYRGCESVKARVGGLGQGLFVAKKIIEGHSGRIELSSEGTERESRTTFELILPRS